MILLFPCCPVAVGGELIVEAVRRDRPSGRLDRAPVSLGPRADFEKVWEQAIEITAIPAVQALYRPEVTQVSPVERDILRPPDGTKPVQRKRRVVIERDKRVQEDRRKKERVDERDRETVPQVERDTVPEDGIGDRG